MSRARDSEPPPDFGPVKPGAPLGAVNWPRLQGRSTQRPRRESYLHNVDGTLTDAGVEHAAAHPEWRPAAESIEAWTGDGQLVEACQHSETVRVKDGLL